MDRGDLCATLSMGSQIVGHDLATKQQHLCIYLYSFCLFV